MSVRSELREAAMERDRYRCRWPDCDMLIAQIQRLEMAHLKQLSQGGPDELDNVVTLCRFHHDVLDNRVVKGRRDAIRVLLEAYLAVY